jgi:hypothetical protein
MSIVALLAALLAPVYFSIRERSSEESCLSNLRQIGAAAIMYRQDNLSLCYAALGAAQLHDAGYRAWFVVAAAAMAGGIALLAVRGQSGGAFLALANAGLIAMLRLARRSTIAGVGVAFACGAGTFAVLLDPVLGASDLAQIVAACCTSGCVASMGCSIGARSAAAAAGA